MKDKTEQTIENVLDYMKSLPHDQAVAFAEELTFAVTLESGNKCESLGILEWAKDSIITAYKNKYLEITDNTVDIDTIKAELAN